jgi:uroporphyrinogen-III synthase
VVRLRALGVDAAALPLLGIAGPADAAPVHAAWALLAGPLPPPKAVPGLASAAKPALVMFVSPSAVERFFALRPPGGAWPAAVIAAGTGPGTQRALLAAGVPEAAVLTPPQAAGQFDSEALWAVLSHRMGWVGQQALIVRGEGGRDWFADTLRQHGAQVHFVEAYRRTGPVPDAAGQAVLQQALARPADNCWLFSSSEAVGHLPALAPGADWSASQALATHARIAEAARRLGILRVQQVAPEPPAVAAALAALPR